jgi:hypothetical protein
MIEEQGMPTNLQESEVFDIERNRVRVASAPLNTDASSTRPPALAERGASGPQKPRNLLKK